MTMIIKTILSEPSKESDSDHIYDNFGHCSFLLNGMEQYYL